ncbi:MAG: sugar phosphate isomerase/epimerase [Clostridia bacterium]|nr:sugar phosphate isomerase/epimerase [Clostridia bacterium]
MIRLSAFSDEAGNSLKEQIEALKRNGISYMEIRNVDGVNVQKMTLEQAEEIQRELEANGIAVWSVGSPVGKVKLKEDFCFEDYLEDVRHICKLANIFKTDKIRMFSFFLAYDKAEEVYGYLRRMVEVANEYGVQLYHENEKKIYGDTSERVLDIMAHVDGLKYIYDPANYLQVDEKADTTLDLLHGKTDYFHIKDVILETGELVPAGYGDGKIDRLIEMITDDKVLSIEPHLAIFEGYSTIDDEQMKNKFHFSSNGEAFDAAVAAVKTLLVKAGYEEKDSAFVKA